MIGQLRNVGYENVLPRRINRERFFMLNAQHRKNLYTEQSHSQRSTTLGMVFVLNKTNMGLTVDGKNCFQLSLFCHPALKNDELVLAQNVMAEEAAFLLSTTPVLESKLFV